MVETLRNSNKQLMCNLSKLCDYAKPQSAKLCETLINSNKQLVCNMRNSAIDFWMSFAGNLSGQDKRYFQ